MNIFEEAAALKKENRVFAIAMITESKGSTPRSSARMLVKENGSIVGTIGGGPVELYVIEQAREAMKEGKNRTCSYTLLMKEKEGMHCGGEMTFFIDVEVPGTTLLLVGAGHVNQAVARIAVNTGFNVIVADNRIELLNPDFFPPHVLLFHGETLEEAVEQTDLDEKTFVLVATGSEDKAGLKAVMMKNPRFLAMLGSRRKALMIKKELLQEGWNEDDLQKVICPAGLDIGAESPGEIALSLLSQMVMVKTETNGRELYPSSKHKNLIIVRGAGDIATGTISRLHKAGYAVLALETDNPTVIRRTVAFAEAVHSGKAKVEGIEAELAGTPEEIQKTHQSGKIALAVDPEGKLIGQLKPSAVIDAILAKKNLGTTRNSAPLTIALGPGFEAGKDVHYVVETSRGHDLGKIISRGPAKANTGIPGNINGFTEERIIRSPSAGKVTVLKEIGSIVSKGEIIASVGKTEVSASIDGLIRGMIRPGTEVTENMKIGDIDPRGEKAQFMTISDKARAIGGSVLEILLSHSLCP
ncbi:MAG: EF2563 family selenium-dependent molybdenum hydroxylase system protein [Spirochaetaceae bacterium]|nr:EF2563 family selenium-dependent molybdenum hydroxylase system protein [Spirochaetaceae bacterium]